MARLVRRHFLPEIGDATLARIVSPLGADVAACVASATCFGVGVGEELSAVPELRLAGTPVLLVNPRQPVATGPVFAAWDGIRSEEHTSELQSLMRNSYAVFCLKKKKTPTN